MLHDYMDPLLSLAFAMHSNRGVYAFLLGSGLSRSAAIPTGWEVVLDLVRKLAAMKGEPCDPDPEAWFQRAFGDAPTYSGLLKRICRTPAERQQLLRSYFEPSPDAADSGEKQPTKAHHAIAALAKTGHVRVILTTNFDRLIERSLETAGVNPVVISMAPAVDGATPLTHAPCTVVKLHGDYLDARIKNTPDELAKYDRRIDRLLDRVFDEFGLVVCGWSAEWDEALRDALTRCKSRRFSTYWALRGTPSNDAQRLIQLRGAQTLNISDADQLFCDLHQKVLSLAALDPPHPLSTKTAVATMKRFLSDARYRIDLHDLVVREVEQVMVATTDEKMPVSGSVPVNADQVQRRMRQYEATTAVLQHLAATGCFWGGTDGDPLWKSALQRLANRPIVGGMTFWIELRQYPAVLAFYAGGMAALAAMNMASLSEVLLGAQLRPGNGDGRERPAVERLNPSAFIDRDSWRAVLPGAEREHTPLNDHLFGVLREPLRDVLPGEDDYDRAFDRFEYLVALLVADRRLTGDAQTTWAPIGRFGWKDQWREEPEVITRVKREVLDAGDAWPPIASGLIASIQRFNFVADVVSQNVANHHWR